MVVKLRRNLGNLVRIFCGSSSIVLSHIPIEGVNSVNEYKNYEGDVYEVRNAFADIEKSEDKRNQFNMEADAIHKKTVEAWDRLFAAIAEITRKHEDSPALRDSKMRQYIPKLLENPVTVSPEGKRELMQKFGLTQEDFQP